MNAYLNNMFLWTAVVGCLCIGTAAHASEAKAFDLAAMNASIKTESIYTIASNDVPMPLQYTSMSQTQPDLNTAKQILASVVRPASIMSQSAFMQNGSSTPNYQSTVIQNPKVAYWGPANQIVSQDLPPILTQVQCDRFRILKNCCPREIVPRGCVVKNKMLARCGFVPTCCTYTPQVEEYGYDYGYEYPVYAFGFSSGGSGGGGGSTLFFGSSGGGSGGSNGSGSGNGNGNANNGEGPGSTTTTTIGDVENGTTIGDVQNSLTTIGDTQNSTSTIGDTQNNTIGDVQNTNTTIGDIQNSTSTIGDVENTNNNTTGNNGVGVPEPGTLTILGGMMSICAYLKRRYKTKE